MSCCGTLHYMAPEMIRHEHYDNKVGLIWQKKKLPSVLDVSNQFKLNFEEKSVIYSGK